MTSDADMRAVTNDTQQSAVSQTTSASSPVRPSGKRRAFGGLGIMLAQFGVAIGLIAAWALAAEYEVVSHVYISSPGEVARYLLDTLPTSAFWNDMAATFEEMIIGFVIGGLAGILVGLLLARMPRTDRVLQPFFTFANALPRVALAPLFVLWWGVGQTSKVILAISIVFFIVMTSTHAGAKTVDPDVALSARVLGASERQMTLKILLPSAVPAIFAGLRLGLVYALLAAIFGEMIAAREGLGALLTYNSGIFNTAGVFGVLIVLGVIGTALNAVAVWAERYLLRWQKAGE